MKCPHCKGEHPDEYKFCPETGKKIELKACVNETCSMFGKHVLPMEAKFCPECGKSLSLIVDSSKEVTNDFFANLKNGIVAYGGIILGRTTLSDMRKLGFNMTSTDKECMVFENENMECVVWNYGAKDFDDEGEIEEITDAWGNDLNEKVFINKEKYVFGFKVDFEDLMDDDYEDWEIENAIEQCDFQEIEYEFDSYTYSEEAVFYVSEKPLCGKYYALITLDDDVMYVSICPFSEWTVRKTGETVYA